MELKLSSRVQKVSESVTLKLNERANTLAAEGKRIYNLTAGQLPFRPHEKFLASVIEETNFLKSFHYSPVAGFKELREKVCNHLLKLRNIDPKQLNFPFECSVSTGAKQSIFNALGAIVDPGDEVLVLAPYWASYTEMIQVWDGRSVAVPAYSHQGYTPTIEAIKEKISKKTKAILLNSPNNPAGIHYSQKWMSQFAQLLREYPQLIVISDEIYYELSYFDPPPSYFYQFDQELLNRTVIIDGISKSLACTGLRIGYSFGPKNIISAMNNIQGQSTSGANSLMQRALLAFDWSKIPEFLAPIKVYLRKNVKILEESLSAHGLSHVWYQTSSAFYFLLDFTQTPVYSRYRQQYGEDRELSEVICADLLEKYGLAIVPGKDFGAVDCGRLSLVLEERAMKEAMDILVQFLNLKI